MSYTIDKDGLPTIEKTASARLDYSFDFTDWLAGDTIQSHTITPHAEPSAGGVTVDQHTAAAGVVTAWLTGGHNGVDSRVTCTITTTAGRIEARTIKVRVVEVRGA